MIKFSFYRGKGILEMRHKLIESVRKRVSKVILDKSVKKYKDMYMGYSLKLKFINQIKVYKYFNPLYSLIRDTMSNENVKDSLFFS